MENQPSQGRQVTQPDESARRLREGWITDRINLIMASYRRDEYANPEGFISQMGLLLEGYGDDVIEQASNIRNSLSIQRSCKFPPNAFEAAECCDRIFADLQRHRRLMAERPVLPLRPRESNPPPTILPRDQRTSYDELKARFGPNWGLKVMPRWPPAETEH